MFVSKFKFSESKKIFFNIFWLGVADGLNRISRWVLVILIFRVFDPVLFGKLSFALNFVFPFALLANFGIGRVIV